MDQKRIIFKKNINETIEKILGDNGLKEDLQDYSEKVVKGIKPYFNILYQSVIKLAGGKINEAIFLDNIQNSLNTSEKTSKNILKDVKEKVLPFAVLISEDEIEKMNAPYGEPSGSAPLVATAPAPSVKRKQIKTVQPTVSSMEQKNKSENDRYRESIG